MTSRREIDWVTVRLRGLGGEVVAEPQMSGTPVTVAQFGQFIARGGYVNDRLWSERGRRWRAEQGVDRPFYWEQQGYEGPDLPITGVSWFEAEAVAKFFGASLPSEQEWLAAASNQGTTRYPWGDDDEGIPETRANLSFFGRYRESGLTDVDRFPEGRTIPGGVVDEPGLLDLLGNVGEWCCPGDSLELDPARTTAVLCGGCSWHDPQVVDVMFRDEITPEVRDNQTGIRLIRRRASAHPAVSVGVSPTSVAPSRPRHPVARPTRPFRQEGIPAGLGDGTWRLAVGGEVARPLALSLDEIKERYPRVSRKGLYVCVCRWGSVDTVSGVALGDVVAEAGPLRPVEDLFVHQRSVPGPGGKVYESSVSLADALAHDAILCYELDGRPLSPELGYPLRLIDFHLLGYKQVKCLGEIWLTSRFVPGWWEEQCRYDPVGIIQPGTITVIGERPYRKEIEKPGIVPIPWGAT